MARALQIVDIRDDPSGGITVEFRFGVPPLNQAHGTMSFQFSDSNDLLQKLRALNEDIDPFVLLLLHLSITAVGANGAMRNYTSVEGKTILFDITAAQPIRIV
jgi:hypothetical protein